MSASFYQYYVLRSSNKLTRTALRSAPIRRYVFPTGGTKSIPIREIRRVSAPTDLGLLNHKGWGMAADFQVWWACQACASNLLSGLHGELDTRVVVSHACWPDVGFTVRDRPAFFKRMEALLGAPGLAI